jgi:hypothetical protein
MILALLKLVLGCLLLFFALQLISNKEASLSQKALGLVLGAFGFIFLFPLILSLTTYTIIAVVVVFIAFIVYKLFV